MQLDFLAENWDTIAWAVPGAWMVIILAVFGRCRGLIFVSDPRLW